MASSAWQWLARQRIAPAMTWRTLLGDDFDGLSRFLLPSGVLADFVPCPRTATTQCGYSVRPGDGDGEFVGFCPEGECPRIELARSSIVLLQVEWQALADEVAKALGLSGVCTVYAPGLAQLGWIAPVMTARYPVFFSAVASPSDNFGHIQRFAERAIGPFVVILPSREALDLEAVGLIYTRNALAVFMDEGVDVGAEGQIDVEDARLAMEEFALVRAGVKAERKLPTFPTPHGAAWSDIRITAPRNEHEVTVAATVRSGGAATEVSADYSFEDFGLMRESADGSVPTKDWEEFFIQLVLHKRVAARTPKGWGRLKTAKKKVSRILGEITGLDPRGAITDHPGLRCYEAVFQVECERGKETPVPSDPRRGVEGEDEVWMNGRSVVIPRPR